MIPGEILTDETSGDIELNVGRVATTEIYTSLFVGSVRCV